MWRRCDLHVHTSTDADPAEVHTADELLDAAEHANLDVIAITDHDAVDRVDDVLEASSLRGNLSVVPGVEVSTDAGHVLVYDPSGSSAALLEAYLKRLGARPGRTTRLGELLEVFASEGTEEGINYRQRLVLVGAHVNEAKSLLAPDQPGPHSLHLSNAKRMHALEVSDPEVLEEWQRRGVKSTGEQMPLVQNSDGHRPNSIGNRSTWLFMPRVDRNSLLHAFGNSEASVSTTAPKPAHPSAHIVSLSLSGGLHGEMRLDFSERINAIVGSPSVGKSFIIDALRYLFDSDSPIEEVSLVSNKRRQRHLPVGTVIAAEICINGETNSYKREVGGAATPDIPTDPVIFSQTELTRRAMEQEPSIGLIDLHTGGLSQAVDDLSALSAKVHAVLDELLALAREHAKLTGRVDNPVDGLDIVEERLSELGGEEDSATRADLIGEILEWRALASMFHRAEFR